MNFYWIWRTGCRLWSFSISSVDFGTRLWLGVRLDRVRRRFRSVSTSSNSWNARIRSPILWFGVWWRPSSPFWACSILRRPPPLHSILIKKFWFKKKSKRKIQRIEWRNGLPSSSDVVALANSNGSSTTNWKSIIWSWGWPPFCVGIIGCGWMGAGGWRCCGGDDAGSDMGDGIDS